MSIKLTNHLEGNFYQHKEFVLEQLASSTGLPAIQGILYTNTADKGFYYFDGTNWKRIDNQSMTANAILTALSTVDGAGSGLDADLLDNQDSTYYLNRANHNGNVPVANITDLATTVQGYRLDQFAIPTADINLNNRKITNLANPASATSSDAAPASWVTTAINNAVQGLDVKQSVKVATSAPLANATYENGTFTFSSDVTSLDGVSVLPGDRVLVRSQSDQTQNGFYVFANPVTLQRVDLLQGASIQANAFVFVEQGTLQDTGWVLSTNSGTVGTDNIVFTQFSSAGIIEAGTGLSKSGNTLSVSFNDLGGGVSISRKQSYLIGNGTATEFTLSTFGSDDKIAVVREVSTGEQVLADVVHLSAVQTRIIFADPPSTNQYRVTVIG